MYQMSDFSHNVQVHLSDPSVILSSIRKVDKGYQQRKENKMFSLKYKMTRIGRFGNVENATTKIKMNNELAINSLLDSEVANGWTILEVEVI